MLIYIHISICIIIPSICKRGFINNIRMYRISGMLGGWEQILSSAAELCRAGFTAGIRLCTLLSYVSRHFHSPVSTAFRVPQPSASGRSDRVDCFKRNLYLPAPLQEPSPNVMSRPESL